MFEILRIWGIARSLQNRDLFWIPPREGWKTGDGYNRISNRAAPDTAIFHIDLSWETGILETEKSELEKTGLKKMPLQIGEMRTGDGTEWWWGHDPIPKAQSLKEDWAFSHIRGPHPSTALQRCQVPQVPLVSKPGKTSLSRGEGLDFHTLTPS